MDFLKEVVYKTQYYSCHQMDLQLQGGQSLDSAVEHIQMEEEMMIPKNILNTTFKLVLAFPCKTGQPQRSWINSTTAKRSIQLLCKAHPLYPARLSEISVRRQERSLGTRHHGDL